MADHDPHITFPECPNCHARQKAVANWEYMTWYCWECKSTGTFKLETTVDGTPPNG